MKKKTHIHSILLVPNLLIIRQFFIQTKLIISFYVKLVIVTFFFAFTNNN